jgi:type VI secretion system secreted protein Hcp
MSRNPAASFSRLNLAVLLAALAPAPALASLECFMKIDGVFGESTDARHKDSIDLISYAWGESREIPSAPLGMPKVKMQEFTFTFSNGRASPALMFLVANGAQAKKAMMTCRLPGATRSMHEFARWTFTDVTFSAYQTAAATQQGSKPIDQVAMNFAQVEYQYTPQLPNGQPGTPMTMQWDVRMNQGSLR